MIFTTGFLPGCRFTLRHSCTEHFVRAGASQEDLRWLLKHKSGSTTLGYMHRDYYRLTVKNCPLLQGSLPKSLGL